MERYHFHLHECGDVTPDYEGIAQPDMLSARDYAIKAAREIMCAEINKGHLCLACSIEVVNAGGQPVMSVPFREAVIITGLSAGY